MLKNNFPKKIMVSSLILIFFILLIMVGKYIFDKATYIPPTTSQQVTKTSESNGYLSSSSQVSKNQSSTEKAQAIVPVKNTGVSEWLQVKSQGSGEKFTDLSTGNFKIYKALIIFIFNLKYIFDKDSFQMYFTVFCTKHRVSSL